MRQNEGIYMTHFYIIRHGETVFNRKGRIQGWCDSPLTDLGVSQAKQLGKELKNVPFDVCFCSTSERAIDTANSILEGRNVKIIPSKNLKEQSFGDFEAEKSVDIFKDGVRFPDGYRFCGGENHSDVIERVTKELKKNRIRISECECFSSLSWFCHQTYCERIVSRFCE